MVAASRSLRRRKGSSRGPNALIRTLWTVTSALPCSP